MPTAAADPSPLHTGAVLDRAGSHAVIECVPCGFRHLDPIPSAAELDAYYAQEYFQHAKPESLEEDEREVEHRNIFFDQRIDFFADRAPNRRLLDVGCGDGLFMLRAKARGFDVEGVEPSDHAAIVAQERGLKVLHGTIDQLATAGAGQFGAVHLRNVLEHVRDPIGTVRICRSLLAPGGVLYIEVPNDYDLSQRWGVALLGERKLWICVPDHINYFSFSSLERLLRREGFTIVRRDTTFPMYFFLCLGLNFIKNKPLGKRLHLWRMRLELGCRAVGLNSLRHLAYRGLSRASLGRTAIVYAQKPR